MRGLLQIVGVLEAAAVGLTFEPGSQPLQSYTLLFHLNVRLNSRAKQDKNANQHTPTLQSLIDELSRGVCVTARFALTCHNT